MTLEEEQTWLDIALAQYGNVATAVQLSISNQQSLSDTLAAGSEVVTIESSYNVPVFATYQQSIKESMVIVQDNQSLLDVSMQVAGDARQAIAIALLNDQALTQPLDAGAELKTAVGLIARDVILTYGRTGYVPATGFTPAIGENNIDGVYVLGVFEPNIYE
jgi:hypothetical protein